MLMNSPKKRLTEFSIFLQSTDLLFLLYTVDVVIYTHCENILVSLTHIEMKTPSLYPACFVEASVSGHKSGLWYDQLCTEIK